MKPIPVFTIVVFLAVSGCKKDDGDPTAGNGGSGNQPTWEAVNNGLTDSSVSAFALSPNGAGGINLFASTHNGGVFLSTNNGTIWTGVNNGLTSPFVYALAASSTHLFVGTGGDGVYVSHFIAPL